MIETIIVVIVILVVIAMLTTNTKVKSAEEIQADLEQAYKNIESETEKEIEEISKRAAANRELTQSWTRKVKQLPIEIMQKGSKSFN